MRLQHFAACSTLALALVLLPAPAAAQPEIVPFGQVADVDQGCTYSPVAIETEGQVVVVWYRAFSPTGIFARTGPSLAELGPAVELAGEGSAGGIAVAVQPGGFLVAWVPPTLPSGHQAVYQRFGPNLTQLGPAVVAGDAGVYSTPGLLVDAGGNVTLAFFDPAGALKARRYSPADAPLTPLIDVAPANPFVWPAVELAAGENGFLAVWLDGTSWWARGFGEDGVPLGLSVNLGAAANSLPYFDLARLPGSYLLVRTGTDAFGRLLGDDIRALLI